MKGGGWFDPTCTATERLVCRGAECSGAGACASGRGGRAGARQRAAFAVVRPPGHQPATPNLPPMGFCLFNNAAIAVRAAPARRRCAVAIARRSTVHHGNGSQDIFYADPTVLYTSVHQFPWYPGTGHASDRGDPGASGTTVNVPVPPGTDGTRWLELFDGVVLPEVTAFEPTWWWSAPSSTPIATIRWLNCRLEDETYRAIAERVRTLTETQCEGRSVWLLEGGYDLRAIAASVARCLHRARRLTRAGVPATAVAALATGATLLLAACAGVPSSLRRRLSQADGRRRGRPHDQPDRRAGRQHMAYRPQPLGLRVHSAPALVAGNVVGGFSQGRSFSVLAYQSGGGGWFHVQGRTLAGWVVADPALTAPGSLHRGSGRPNGVTALYPQTWASSRRPSERSVPVPAGDATRQSPLETAATPQDIRCERVAGLPGNECHSDRGVRLHRHPRLLHEGGVVHRRDGCAAPGREAAVLCRGAPQVRLGTRNADRIQLPDQQSWLRRLLGDMYNSIAFPYPLCEAPAGHVDADAANPREPFQDAWVQY